jgi:hypothetical protein
VPGNFGDVPPGGQGQELSGGPFYLDEERKLLLPLASRAEVPGHATGPKDTTSGHADQAEAADAVKSFRATAVPRVLAVTICAGLAFLILLFGVDALPTPVLELVATLPVLVLDYVIRKLDDRTITFPAAIRAVLRRVRTTIGYAALLVIAADIEGALLTVASGSTVTLGLLNIATGVAIGALIGWRSPRDAIWTIVETAYVASMLGVLIDLGFLGAQRFSVVHFGASLVFVVTVSGTVYAASGTQGYLGLREGQRLRAPASPAGGPGPEARTTITRERVSTAAGSGVALLALAGSLAYVAASSATGGGAPRPGSYSVNREIASAGAVVVTLVRVQVAQNGKTALFITYSDTGLSTEKLACTGFTSPSAAAIRLSDGEVIDSVTTYCSDHPGAVQKVAPGRSFTSYATFLDASGLGQAFAFSWQAGALSGTISGVSLSGH